MDLYKKAVEFLEKELPVDRESVCLLFEHAPLDRELSLVEAKITDDCTLFVNFRALKQKLQGQSESVPAAPV